MKTFKICCMIFTVTYFMIAAYGRYTVKKADEERRLCRETVSAIEWRKFIKGQRDGDKALCDYYDELRAKGQLHLVAPWVPPPSVKAIPVNIIITHNLPVNVKKGEVKITMEEPVISKESAYEQDEKGIRIVYSIDIEHDSTKILGKHNRPADMSKVSVRFWTKDDREWKAKWEEVK